MSCLFCAGSSSEPAGAPRDGDEDRKAGAAFLLRC